MTKQQRPPPPAPPLDSPDGTISVIGPGMSIIGDCHAKGTVRIEGAVEGSVQAGKAIVIGKGGMVMGDIKTQDAVISGRIQGKLVIDSRLELQASSQVEGTIDARRIVLEDGAIINGTVKMAGAGSSSATGPDESGLGS